MATRTTTATRTTSSAADGAAGGATGTGPATGSARSAYAEHLAALRAAQKPARGTAAYSRFVNRPAARRVAAAGAVVGLTPNGATAISAALSTAGLVLVALARPSWAVGLAVAVLLALGYVLDSVDGQLARLRGGGSLAGEWLDHTVDCVKNVAVHLVVLVSFYRFPPWGAAGADRPDAWLLLLPAAFLVVDATYYFNIITLPFLRARATAGTPGTPGTPGGPGGPAARPAHAAVRESRWRTWLLLPTDQGTVCWVFVLLGWGAGFVAGYGLLLAANAGLLLLGLRKWWGELRALDAASAAAAPAPAASTAAAARAGG